MHNYVKTRRTEKGMTQEEVARTADISLTEYRNIEKGRRVPSIYITLKLKKALQLATVEELFTLEETE